jgi:hypothetical protein
LSKPPEDVPASELFLKLCEPRPSEVIDFPRKDRNGNYVGKCRIQVLKAEDHDRARIIAQKALKAKVAGFGIEALDQRDMESPAVREVLGDLTAHEILSMAVLEEKPAFEETEERAAVYARVFPNTATIPRTLTADETLALYNAYMLVQHKYGPFERTINSDEELDDWVNRLEEGGAAFPLLALTSPQLAELTSSLAARISSVCRILASRWESLPDTLKSDLAPFCTGIGSFGVQRVESTLNTYSEKLDDPVRIEQALRMSMEQKLQRE